MTHLNRQGQTQDPVKTGSDSFAARVASLPTGIRLRLLTNAVSRDTMLLCVFAIPLALAVNMQGVSEAQFSGEQSVKDTDWGFATKVPAVQILLQQTTDQPCQSGTNINQPDSGDSTAGKHCTGSTKHRMLQTARVQAILQRCVRAEPSTVQTALMPWLKLLALLQLLVTSGLDPAHSIFRKYLLAI